MTPEITEIKVTGRNLFRRLNPEAKDSQIVLNFNPEEVVKADLDFEALSYEINPSGTESVIFSRKIRK